MAEPGLCTISRKNEQLAQRNRELEESLRSVAAALGSKQQFQVVSNRGLHRRLKVPGFTWYGSQAGHGFYTCERCRALVRGGSVKNHRCQIQPKKDMRHRVVVDKKRKAEHDLLLLPSHEIGEKRKRRRKKRHHHSKVPTPLVVTEEEEKGIMLSGDTEENIVVL